jgi:hypothetical protein
MGHKGSEINMSLLITFTLNESRSVAVCHKCVQNGGGVWDMRVGPSSLIKQDKIYSRTIKSHKRSLKQYHKPGDLLWQLAPAYPWPQPLRSVRTTHQNYMRQWAKCTLFALRDGYGNESSSADTRIVTVTKINWVPDPPILGKRTGCSSPGDKASRTWGWPLTSF